MRATTLLISLALLAACERSSVGPTQPGEEASAPVVEATPQPSSAPTPSEPAPEPEPEQLAEALLDDAEALGELHRAHAEDCAALAKTLEGFHAEHGAALREASPEAHAWIDAHEPLQARLHAAMESVMTVSMACRDDAEFTAMQQALFGQPAAASPG